MGSSLAWTSRVGGIAGHLDVRVQQLHRLRARRHVPVFHPPAPHPSVDPPEPEYPDYDRLGAPPAPPPATAAWGGDRPGSRRPASGWPGRLHRWLRRCVSRKPCSTAPQDCRGRKTHRADAVGIHALSACVVADRCHRPLRILQGHRDRWCVASTRLAIPVAADVRHPVPDQHEGDAGVRKPGAAVSAVLSDRAVRADAQPRAAAIRKNQNRRAH